MPVKGSSESLVADITIDSGDEFKACWGEFILPFNDSEQAELYAVLQGCLNRLRLHSPAHLGSVT